MALAENVERLPDWLDARFDPMRMNQMVQILERRLRGIEEVLIEQDIAGGLGGSISTEYAPLEHVHGLSEISDYPGDVITLETEDGLHISLRNSVVLGDLSDVDVTGAAANYALVRNATNTGWITASVSGGGGSGFSPVITDLETNDLLQFNGVNWVNVDPETDLNFVLRTGDTMEGELNFPDDLQIRFGDLTHRVGYQSSIAALAITSTRDLFVSGGVSTYQSFLGGTTFENLTPQNTWAFTDGVESLELRPTTGDFELASLTAGSSFSVTGRNVGDTADNLMIEADPDASVRLFEAGTERITTEPDGATVSGTLLTLTSGVVQDTNFDIENSLGGWRHQIDNLTGQYKLIQLTGGAEEDEQILVARNGRVRLANNGEARLDTSQLGIEVFGPTSNRAEIELTAIGSQDAALLVQNTNGGYRLNLEAASGALELWQTSFVGADEELWISAVRNGAVSLWYDGTETFRTQTNDAQVWDGAGWVSLVLNSRDITINGTASEVDVAGGTQDLSADRTWTVGLSDDPVVPGVASMTIPTGTTAQEPVAANGMIRWDTDLDTLRFAEGITPTWRSVAWDGGAFHDGFSDFVTNEHIDHSGVTVTLTGDTNEIAIGGAAQDLTANLSFTVGIADNPVIPGVASVQIPAGTTAQEPTPVNGMLRYDSTTGKLRGVEGGAWTDIVGAGGGSSTLAGLTDVTLTAPAQGDLFYRGATDWNNTPNLSWDETNDILRVGVATGQHIDIDGGDTNPIIQAWTNVTGDNLQLNPNGGSVRVGSASAAGGFDVYNSGGVVGMEIDVSGQPSFRSTTTSWRLEVFDNVAGDIIDWLFSGSATNQMDFYSNGSPLIFRGEPSGGGALQNMLSLDPDGTKTLYYDGDIAQVLTINEVQFRSNTLGNDPTTGGVQNVSVVLHNNVGAQLARLGYLTQSTLQLTNDIHGGLIQLRAEDTAGTERVLIQADPDDDIKLYDAGTEVARTLPAASGGFEVNNTSTGAGFERVLTTSDLSGGGGNVSNTGTPVDNQIAVWTNATTIEGTTNLTYDGSTFSAVGATLNLDNSANNANTVIKNWNSIGGVGIQTNSGSGFAGIYQISNTGAVEDLWIGMARNGSVDLRYDNIKKVQTTSTGININSGSGGNVDLQIQAGTTNLVAIDMWNGTDGGLSMEMISGSGGDFRIAQQSNGNALQDVWQRFYRDGAVELYHNNVAKLATTANGMDVSGTLIELDTGAISDGEVRILTSLGGVGIVVDGSTTGRLDILQTTSAGAVEDTWIRAARNGAVSLFHNNAERIETTTSGINVIGPTGQGTIELTGIASNDANLLVQNGNGGFRANVEAATGDFELWQTSNVGVDQDLWIYGDRDGAVSLYFNGVLTAQTRARGFQILSDATAPSTAGSLLEWLGSDAGRWGWAGFGLSSDTLRIENERHGGLVQLAGEDTATGASKLILQGDPDAEVILYYNGIEVLHTNSQGVLVYDTVGNDPLIQFRDDANTVLSRVQHFNNNLFLRNETNGSETQLQSNGSDGTARVHIRTGANTTATAVGFHNTAPIAKPTVTGSRGGNAALASLLTALANYGLITDSST